MSNLFAVIKGLRLTEKSTISSEKSNTYVFKVDSKATKLEIEAAITKLLGKKVLKVNTVNYSGKLRQRGQVKPGRDGDWKKAYVKLAPGETIDLV